jgi:hypothetical protein
VEPARWSQPIVGFIAVANVGIALEKFMRFPRVEKNRSEFDFWIKLHKSTGAQRRLLGVRPGEIPPPMIGRCTVTASMH